MNELNCPNCRETVSQIEIECTNCGYPLAGTEKEKAIFIGRQISNKTKIGDAKSSQKNVQKILFAVAAFQVINAFRISRVYGYDFDFVFYMVLSIIIAGLAFLSPKKPLLATSLSLGVILGYYILIALIDINFLFAGLIWKLAIISTLGYGFALSYDEYKLKKQYNFLNDE